MGGHHGLIPSPHGSGQCCGQGIRGAPEPLWAWLRATVVAQWCTVDLPCPEGARSDGLVNELYSLPSARCVPSRVAGGWARTSWALLGPGRFSVSVWLSPSRPGAPWGWGLPGFCPSQECPAWQGPGAGRGAPLLCRVKMPGSGEDGECAPGFQRTGWCGREAGGRSPSPAISRRAAQTRWAWEPPAGSAATLGMPLPSLPSPGTKAGRGAWTSHRKLTWARWE